MSPVCANGRLIQKPGKDFARQSRGTPPEIYAVLDDEFRFTLDPCPLDATATAGASLWGKDGLQWSWKGERVFCNPPYGAISPWLKKAYEAIVAVYLLPVRSDLDWWHDYAMRADEARFIHRRLRFAGTSGGAPFPSVVLVFDLRRGRAGTRYTSMERPER